MRKANFKTTQIGSISRIIGNNKICGENVLPIKLEIVGGRLGYKAKWIWYKNTIESSNKIGEGRELVINQPTPGNILVRAEGVSNNTSTSSIQIDLLENSVRPDNLNISKEIICEGEQIILKILGGKLANDAKWVIYKSDINPINKLTSGVENEFRILPNISINYVVRAEGFCNVTATVSTKIMVLKQSSRPVTINYIKKDGSENSFQLKTVGGLLGDQAKWGWYKGECNEKKIGTGEVISYNLKHNDKISVRAEGFCNTTECIFIQPAIKNNQDWYIPNFINAGIVTSDFKNTPNTFFAFGSKKYYLKIKTSLGFLYPDRPILTDYLSDNIKILNYKPRNSGYTYLFNGSIVAERESYCIGYISRIFNIKLFVGGGYGKYNLFWGIDEYYSNTIDPINVFEWAKNLNSSYSGFEIETGLMVNINKINIMTGFNSILSSKRVPFIDFSLGIGYSF